VRIAELEADRDCYALQWPHVLARAEKAEADCKRAEAERDALREALARIERESIDDVSRADARAALAPSPAGREG